MPSGERLVSFVLTTRTPAGPTQSVPVCWFGAPSSARRLGIGAEVVVTGSVRCRVSSADDPRADNTAVVAQSVVPARQRLRVAGAIDVAVAAITEDLVA